MSILDLNHRDHHPGFHDSIDAISTAVELIGNANTRISCLRQEKVTLSLNKTLLHLYQIRTMQSTVPLGPSKQFYWSAPQQHGWGEASSYFQRSSRNHQQFSAQKTSGQPANQIPKQELTYNTEIYPFYNLKEIQKSTLVNQLTCMGVASIVMNHKLAGWLQNFLENWEVITKISGYSTQHRGITYIPKRNIPTLHVT